MDPSPVSRSCANLRSGDYSASSWKREKGHSGAAGISFVLTGILTLLSRCTESVVVVVRFDDAERSCNYLVWAGKCRKKGSESCVWLNHVSEWGTGCGLWLSAGLRAGVLTLCQNFASALNVLTFSAFLPHHGPKTAWVFPASMHCAANLASNRERKCCPVPNSSTTSVSTNRMHVPIGPRPCTPLPLASDWRLLLNETQVWSRLAQRKIWPILDYQAAITNRPAGACCLS
jgi:hypothetical protein